MGYRGGIGARLDLERVMCSRCWTLRSPQKYAPLLATKDVIVQSQSGTGGGRALKNVQGGRGAGHSTTSHL